jgi:hypothetical protein
MKYYIWCTRCLCALRNAATMQLVENFNNPLLFHLLYTLHNLKKINMMSCILNTFNPEFSCLMLCLMCPTDVICYIHQQVLNLVYRLREDGSDVPKRIKAMNDHTWNVSLIRALSWFCKLILSPIHGMSNFAVTYFVQSYELVLRYYTYIQSSRCSSYYNPSLDAILDQLDPVYILTTGFH